jgi:formamidopyrimidine-DNA glycosylase
VPELPEVEIVRRGLERHVVGRTIESVELLHPRALRRHLAGPDDFAAALRGRKITAALRRGKYLWLPVGDDAVLAHLGMSGQMLVGDPSRPLSPHVRVRLTFTDCGPDLRFSDQRTFGHLSFAPGGAILPAAIAHIAPDPLEAAFDLAAVTARIRSRRTGIKRALLDQSLVSGIGNIYADEALWRARRHWARRSELLKPGQPVRQRERPERLLRAVARRVRAGGPAVPAVRDPGAAGRLHEQVGVQLPQMPAAPPELAVIPGEAARLTVWVEGRVQGVGFRWWARARALELDLVGWAENLEDGRVRVIAEGGAAACSELLALLEGSETPGRVIRVTHRWDEPHGGLTGFSER